MLPQRLAVEIDKRAADKHIPQFVASRLFVPSLLIMSAVNLRAPTATLAER